MRLSGLLSICCICLFASEDGLRVDNNVVHIVEIIRAPRVTRETPRHERNRVLISLGSGNIERTTSDGRSTHQHWKTGQALWIPAGESYVDTNAGSAPMRFIEIELKNPGLPQPVARNPELDPIAIDPKHNILLLENDQVRVFRSWREPGATEKMHEHTGAGRAAVLLTDLNATVKASGGSVSALKASFGDVLWSGTVTHATTNLASGKFDMVVVEVK
jgi:hypothetical protein